MIGSSARHNPGSFSLILIPKFSALLNKVPTPLLWLHFVILVITSLASVETMRVHPVSRMRNITVRYDVASGITQKKLRRLPHIFSRVLELPFRSDADVAVEEKPDCFRFIAMSDDIGDGVRAHAIEIYPGVVKVVVRDASVVELLVDELELDVWRFRLPMSTRPELATAEYVERELIVTVPKDEGLERENLDGGVGGGGEFWGGDVGRLVLVQ